jgi:hypothetical protein
LVYFVETCCYYCLYCDVMDSFDEMMECSFQTWIGVVVARDILAGILHSIVAAVLQTVAVLRLLHTWANIRMVESFVEQSFLEVVDMVVERLDMGMVVHHYMVQEAVRLDDRHQEEEAADRHAEIVHLAVAAFPL